MPTIEEFVRRDAERLMESDPEYRRAKREVQEAEDELMSMLTLEPAMAFVLYEERREKLEKERIRTWLKAVFKYYERRTGDEEE